MSLAVLQKAAGDLHLCHGNIGKVKFFGGEPLLEYDLLRQGYSFLKENGFAGTFEVGTNGILLEDDIISWLSERPDIQVNLNAWFDNAAIMMGRKGHKSSPPNRSQIPGRAEYQFKLRAVIIPQKLRS